MLLFLLYAAGFLCVGLVAQYGLSVCMQGISIQKSISRTGNHGNAYQIDLPVAWALSSWVKTDADTAAGNLAAGHGQTDGKYDVFWTSGGGGRRYGVDGTIATNALSLDGGTGDNFPSSADVTVVVCKQVSINTAIDGDAVAITALNLEYVDPAATSKGHLDMQDVGAATVASVDLSANKPTIYDITGGDTNSLTGNPITVTKASHSNTTYAAVLKIISLESS